MKTIKELWFADERLFIKTAKDDVMSQPMRFFPRLRKATDNQRSAWSESPFGLHWKVIDEDISFEISLGTTTTR